MNPNQPALIRSAIGKMEQGVRMIVIETDNDEPGRALAHRIEAIAFHAGREDLRIVRDLPAGEMRDWNDVLRAGLPTACRDRTQPDRAGRPGDTDAGTGRVQHFSLDNGQLSL